MFYYYTYFFSLIFFIISCTDSENSNIDLNTDKVNKTQTNSEQPPSDPNCVDFVALWSSGDISKRIGKDKKWVFLNYTVDIWDIPPTDGPGNIIGELRASSYAQIIDRTEDDYLVESPITKVHGWLNSSHVKTISKKNIITRKLCD